MLPAQGHVGIELSVTIAVLEDSRMKNLRMVFTLLLACSAMLVLAGPAMAIVSQASSDLARRAIAYDRVLTTPPHATAEQHHLIAVTLAAHHSQVASASEIQQILDELAAMVVYLQASDTTFWWDGAQWVSANRTTYAYSGTKLTEYITESSGDGTTWVNETRTVIAYDGNGRLSTITSFVWVGSWVNQNLLTFTYDGSGNIISTLSQEWNGSAWVNEFNSVMTYTGSNLATMTSQLWSGSAWVNFRKDIYTYGGDGVTEILTQSWTGSWSDAERIVYTYDGSGRRTQSLSQLWRNSSWRNWVKNDYSYDGATENEILDVHSDWDTAGSAWVEGWADTSRYSADRRIELVTAYFTFPFVTRFLYAYDGAGNLTETINQNGPGPSWLNYSRTVDVYTIAGIFDDDAAAGMPSSFSLFQNYPNPFNQTTLIPYSLAGDSHVKITVSNILGQTISTVVDEFQTGGTRTALWSGRDANGRSVASGIYFFRVQVGQASQVRKMVLLK